MTPEKALDLVGRYSALTKDIKALKARISDCLDQCHGISGERRFPVDQWGMPVRQQVQDAKGFDSDIHLGTWYKPEVGGDSYDDPVLVYELIILEKHGIQCKHCYEAHLAIEGRKAARKELAHVKGAMTRSTR